MIFSDAVLQAQIPAPAATVGHVVIQPVNPANELSELPLEQAQHLFTCASLVATALFETLGAHGTNIVIQEGAVRADVYARTQEDGLGLMWEPKPTDKEALSAVASKIKEAFWYVGKQPAQENAPTSTSDDEPVVVSPGEEDYRIKQLRRGP